MARVVERKNLSKHLPEIVFNEKLKNLTAEQIDSIAIMMEIAYQKGKEDALKLIKPTIHYSVERICDQTEIEKAVKKAIDKTYDKMRKQFNV
jgi:hypothetical protein